MIAVMTAASQQSSEARLYRPRQYYLWLGVLTLLCFGAMGVGSVVAALWNLDGSFAHPRASALVFGVFWSGFACLSLWMLAAWYRERLFLDASQVISRGVARTKRVTFEGVNRLEWHRRPVGGSVVLRTAESRLVIEFANYTRSERREIVDRLREAVPADRQDGWIEFTNACRVIPSRSPMASAASSFLLWGFATFFFITGVRLSRVEYIVLGLLNVAIAVAPALILFSKRSATAPRETS